MTRPPANFTSGQLDAISKYAEAEARDKDSTRQYEKALREFNESMDKANARLARDRAFNERWGPWIARIFLIPCLILAIGTTFLLIHGLAAGEIKEINRYSKLVVVLAVHPYQFFASVIYHLCLSAFLWWVTVLAWRSSRWRRS